MSRVFILVVDEDNIMIDVYLGDKSVHYLTATVKEVFETLYKAPKEKVKIAQIYIQAKQISESTKRVMMMCQEDTNVIFKNGVPDDLRMHLIPCGDEYKIKSVEYWRQYEKEYFKLYFLITFRARGVHAYRREQLQRLKAHINEYLKGVSISYEIVVLEQYNDLPFNRGLLYNAGFSECEKELTEQVKYYVLHNCDLFPEKGTFDYSYISEFEVRDATPYAGGLGGITVINRNTMIRTNGFPNDFFGWGSEDVCYMHRCRSIKVTIVRPTPQEVINEECNSSIVDASFNSKNMLKLSTDKPAVNGIKTCKYTIVSNEKQNDEQNVTHIKIDFSEYKCTDTSSSIYFLSDRNNFFF